ncbi:MAG: DNA repair protein RadA [Bacteroidales bacterium]|nr:DNA repair protein RadA [Bacteroidales bacterium]
MITITNINEKWDEINGKLSPDTVKIATDNGFLESAQNWEDLKDFFDDEAKDLLNKFIDRVNKELEANKTDSEPKAKKESKPQTQKQTKEKAQKQPKAKKEFSGEYVEALCPELAHIKRYCALNGKKVSEARETARRILASLQKAIVEKKIRKTSPYADEVMKLQSNLIKILDAPGNSEINIQNAEELKTLVKGFAVMPNIRLVKSFIAIQGKENVKEKAKDLLKKIEASKDDHFKSEIEEIKRSLNKYIDGKSNTPEISAQSLAGLYGLCGIELKGCKSGSAVGSAEFLSAKFTVLPFTGKYKQLIGRPSEPFRIMIYGKAGSGKSSFALQFAQYIAGLGKKVLFVANEEKFGYTLQEKMRRYNIAHKNLFIVDTMPASIKEYDVVFIDSVNSIGYEPEDLRKLDAKKSFVFIFQCIKDGNFRGSQEFEHDVDTSIVVESFKAKTVKNRFGGNGEVNV